MKRRTIQWGPLVLGDRPLVVGTISTLEGLMNEAVLADPGCDVVEVRLDQVGTETMGWAGHCQEIEANGLPVILTLRHIAEGGAWDGSDERRLQLVKKALPSVSAVDVEIRHSALDTWARVVHDFGKVLIGSFHDFEKTPPRVELEAVVEEGRETGVDIVKLATWIENAGDEQTLDALVRDEAYDVYLCALGMGPGATETRVRLARAGSCLTYGYLDRSVAPGQAAARDLRDALADG